jgi:hypothetical protein
VDLLWNLAFTVALTAAILIGTTWGSLGVAVAVAAAHLTLQPIYLMLGQRLLRKIQIAQPAGL